MKAQTGIGTLIVFISLVLTAALAAFLITSTTSGAQSKAYAVATQAVDRAGTTLEIVRVDAVNVNTTAQTANEFYLYVRLAPGASPINLNNTLLIFYTSTGSEVFYYSPTAAIAGQYYTVNMNMSYDASGLLGQGIVGPGDLAVIDVIANLTLTPNQPWRFSLIPPNGQPADVSGVAPNAFLYPDIVLLE